MCDPVSKVYANISHRFARSGVSEFRWVGDKFVRDYEGLKHSVHFYFHCGATENWQARVVPQKYNPFNNGKLRAKTSKSVKCCGELWLISVVVHPLVLAAAQQSRVPNRTNSLSGYVFYLYAYAYMQSLNIYYQYH